MTTFDIEYQTEDSESVILWLRTDTAKQWAEAIGRQRVGLTLPVPPDSLEATLASAIAYGLTCRPLQPE